MDSATNKIDSSSNSWNGGTEKPLGSRYGKLMIWFFILSDALTFLGFLVAYGLIRFKFIDSWPIADEVFNHFPFLHGDHPMLFVAFMTFLLIFSSVTMVLAVDAGKSMKKNKVTTYLFLTIVGGVMFLGSQAWEWKNFINGTYGAVKLSDGKIIQFVDVKTKKQVPIESFVKKESHTQSDLNTSSIWFKKAPKKATYQLEDVLAGFDSNKNLSIRLEKLNPATKQKIIVPREKAATYLAEAELVVKGANMIHNEYGKSLFANFFFFITGFHGFHVFSGIVLNCIVFSNVLVGTYEKRGHYRMVEKVGLYWHFVDLVWVFVFTFFYLV
jgi:cytochrome c oxidase subunit 3